jgi:hypothetical protein
MQSSVMHATAVSGSLAPVGTHLQLQGSRFPVVAAVVHALLHHQVLEHVGVEVEGAAVHFQHAAGTTRSHLNIEQPLAVNVKQVVAVAYGLQDTK